jgi:hypothetical protein
MLGAACGGDGDDDEEPDDAQPTPTTCASDTAELPATPTAASALLPSLTDLCLGMTESGRDPAELAGMQSALALYKGTDPKEQVQVRIYVLPSADLAKAQYTAFAEALRNPPPEFVGVNAKFVDTMSPEVGEDRKSYMTEKPDTGGASVWADVYLKGRTVLLVQVVDVSEDGQPLRTQAAERALSSAP